MPSGVILDCEPARHLFIGVPCYSGEPKYKMAMSMMYEMYLLGAAGVVAEPFMMSGNCYLDQARCQVAERFLKSDATDLLFWDDDVSCAPGSTVSLAKLRRPLVSGVYRKKTQKNGEPTWEWPIQFLEDKPKIQPDGCALGARLPTGFMRINRAVFDTMEDKLQPAIFKDPDGSENRQFFKCQVTRNDPASPRKAVYWGEDWLFCEDWRSLGGECWLFPDLTLTHTGLFDWVGNFKEFSDTRLRLANETGLKVA